MKFLLDTTVISDFTRGVPAVMERLKMTTKTDVWISTVAVMQIDDVASDCQRGKE